MFSIQVIITVLVIFSIYYYYLCANKKKKIMYELFMYVVILVSCFIQYNENCLNTCHSTQTNMLLLNTCCNLNNQ